MINRSILLFLCLCTALPALAEVVTREITYRAGDTEMRGMLAWDDALSGERPGVLVVHEWWGQNDYARERARMLADLGYSALAVDMYGDGRTAEQIAAFKAEMDAAGADYEFVSYPGAVHSFTNPEADAAGKKFGLPWPTTRKRTTTPGKRPRPFSGRSSTRTEAELNVRCLFDRGRSLPSPTR